MPESSAVYEVAPHPRPDLLVPTPGEHVWTATAVYRLNVEMLRVASGAQFHLDQENLATVLVGCWVCEQPYSGRLSHRHCPGKSR